MPSPQSTAPRPIGTAAAFAEVFLVFLKLGLTSFGGPVAHLGYFRQECVTRRHWLSEAEYAELMALCQFLPGPASSQLGFALGLSRAGWPGAFAAFLGFTLPSALLMFGLALAAQTMALPIGLIAGLKILAVAVVAQAVLGMAKSLCPDPPRAAIATLAVVLLALLPSPCTMALVIALGAAIGLFWQAPLPAESRDPAQPLPISKALALSALGLCLILLLALPFLAPLNPTLALFDAFSRAGALVFGGGHVVLPLLEAETVANGQITANDFLTGYAAAQAMPGPLFTFAAWLGALSPPYGVTGALIALLAIFLPGFLLLIAALPYWEALQRHPKARAGMAGANAAVVGILGLALYDPVFTSAVATAADFALALVCLTALTAFKAPSLLVMLLAAIGGLALTGLG